MSTPDRRDRLLSYLQASGRASVSDLATGLGVTSATIRRDLQRLASEGRLLRTYGGAALPDRRSVLVDLGRVWLALNRTPEAHAALLAASRGGEPRAAELARELLPAHYPFVSRLVMKVLGVRYWCVSVLGTRVSVNAWRRIKSRNPG